MPVGTRKFSHVQNVQTSSVVHPTPFLISTVSCLGLEQPGYEVNHSSPSIAEVKNGWSSSSTLAVSPHGMDRDKLYLF